MTDKPSSYYALVGGGEALRFHRITVAQFRDT